jgi:Ca-activated chloride channel family protein
VNVTPVDALKYQPSSRTDLPSHSSPDLLTVKLRYKQPDGDKNSLIERSLVDSDTDFNKASPDFRFAAAVAEFGMILRDSPHKGDASLAAVLDWAQEAKGRDESGYRAGFVDLARKAQALAF